MDISISTNKNRDILVKRKDKIMVMLKWFLSNYDILDQNTRKKYHLPLCVSASQSSETHLCTHCNSGTKTPQNLSEHRFWKGVARWRTDTFSTKIIVLVYSIWLVHCSNRLSLWFILRLGTGWWPPIRSSVFFLISCPKVRGAHQFWKNDHPWK